jgi:hypothetical protein
MKTDLVPIINNFRYYTKLSAFEEFQNYTISELDSNKNLLSELDVWSKQNANQIKTEFAEAIKNNERRIVKTMKEQVSNLTKDLQPSIHQKMFGHSDDKNNEL